jgi:tight adherence protein C
VLILLLALMFIVAAIRLAAVGLAHGSKKTDGLARIEAYGFSAAAAAAPEQQGHLRDRLDSAASVLGTFLDRYLKSDGDPELRRHLYSAGLYTMTPAKFRGYRAMATFSLVAFWFWVGTSRGVSPALLFAGLAACGTLGWFAPMFVVKRRATARLDQIDYEMPEFVDLLVTAVEGGLGFSASIQLAARNFEGPLGEEFRLALREHHMGLTMSEALANMLTRTDTMAARSFVQAVIQGERLGVSVGKVLRDLASEMRRRRRRAAEERAHKAGTKILFPLVLLIFPALFVVILGPVLISLVRDLGGG